LTNDELNLCVAILKRGTAVDPAFAARELPLEHACVLTVLDGVIVGVGAIKRPRPYCAAKISRSSGFRIIPVTPELGYVAIDTQHRGKHLSSRMVGALVSAHRDPLYATTDSDEMKAVLAKAGFKKRGHEWDGERGCLSQWGRSLR
jgi:RimJ/RimL family protein N-acetyltransferase